MPLHRRRVVKPLVALAVAIAAVTAFVVQRDRSSSGAGAPPIPAVHARDFERITIYRSPGEPRYTAWVGAWEMPDGTLLTAFTQATSAGAPARRARAPRALLDTYGRNQADFGYDFWGLALTARYLSSDDGGDTWRPFRVERFKALYPHGYSGAAQIGLTDGTILRRVNGDDLRHDPNVPHTAFLQRLAPGATTWSTPQVLMDPRRFTYQITRLRYLRDGRLIATGNYWNTPAATPPSQRGRNRYLLMVSGDDGRTWRNGLTIGDGVDEPLANEWDTAEFRDGDLVAVLRAARSREDSEQVRKQALLEKRGDGWVMTRVTAAPFPHSGQPELLATAEGPILHIATTGVHYTRDGITWTPLRFVPRRAYTSNYYPRALQTAAGTIRVFAHVGADDPFGANDQAITMDSFRLVPEAERSAAGAR